jgi:hypothetical protein
MANVVISYFFPPQWNFEYGGAISLGNIIDDPNMPQNALNEEDRQPLPRLTVNHTKPLFKATISVDLQQSAGLGTSLLQLFGFGADIKAERGKTRVYTIEAEKLLTQEINPLSTYVEKYFNHAEVKSHLERTGFRDLYMVVGIMAASTATVSSDIGRKRLFEGKVGANFAPAGAPVALEASASHKSETRAQVSFGKSDFILGYRLRKITYMKTGRLKKMEDVKRGTVLDDDAELQSPEMIYDVNFHRLEEKEIDAREFELESVIVEDEESGEKFEFVVPEED